MAVIKNQLQLEFPLPKEEQERLDRFNKMTVKRALEIRAAVLKAQAERAAAIDKLAEGQDRAAVVERLMNATLDLKRKRELDKRKK
ncbi:MAG: hypothetical protein KA787_02575 [Bacteroidia bacterium]|nr:hypothetical protein [Bacteroidia bacterium]MBP7772089.1 hypothetical protein [Bacteroidia bacterium]